MILPAHLADWPPLWRERFEERAAIKEFSANLPRPMAEREAEIDIRKLAWKEIT